MTDIADSILHFVECREAQQIQYGLYGVVITGQEVIDAALATESETATALLELWQRREIIRFEDHNDVRDWLFRSRIAEMVRLVSKVRQRVVGSVQEQRRHRADRSPRLVHDLKYEVQERQAPERNLPVTSLTQILTRSQENELQQVATILEALFPIGFSGFQQRSFHHIVNHILLKPRRGELRGAVITANTGAGKTYAFFLPVLAYCMVEKGLRGRPGVKTICLYPRVALSENQLEDFVRLIYRANQHLPYPITVGVDSGASPYSPSDFGQPDHQYLQERRGWRWDAANRRYICPFARCPVCEQELAVAQIQTERIFCTSCGEAHPFILYAKEQFCASPPDILVTTTESLNSRLMDSHYQMLFGNTNFLPPAAVMLDEIHLQSSTKGSQIALLLRRLVTRLQRGSRGQALLNLMLTGLSATIARPKTFFSDLTGLTQAAIAMLEPDPEEMSRAGAERYLFVRAEQEQDTAVISTLLQTCMVVVHNMPSPSPGEQAQGIARYKTFGFAQSLDIVGRWLYQLVDAERMNQDNRAARAGLPPERWPITHTPLYWYRLPPHNRHLFPDFFGRHISPPPCDCEHRGHPNLGCLYFQEGECWWAAQQSSSDPLNIKRKTANDRQNVIEPDDDLIITTSALEVGYDDVSIMGVIQYQAPSNVASFVQRKGRGGRSVGARPIITTVLSPYKTADVFLYQNHHLLVQPRFKKLPLNPTNIFLQRVHGFYALFDWLAYLAAEQDLSIKLDDMTEEAYETLKQITSRPQIFDDFRDYLATVLGQSDPAHLQMLLVDPEARAYHDNGILSRGLALLMEALHEAHDIDHSGPIKPRQGALRDFLPQNLFSDVNLPELNVHYGHERGARAEAISLGLAETIPGNVTFRGGRGSSWIAPLLITGQVFTLDDVYELSNERRHQIPIELNDLPLRVEARIRGQQRLRPFTLFRPTAVRLTRFGDRDGSHWWFDGTQEPGELRHAPAGQAAPQGVNIRQVSHASGAYPIGFTQIETRSPGRAYSLDARDNHPLFNAWGRNLFRRVDFASDADNGRLMRVRQVIVGSQYSLKLKGADEALEGVTTFIRSDAPDELAAIGYEMHTEGIRFTLNDFQPAAWAISPETAVRLKRNFIKHAVVTELSARPDINYFAAERFAEVMLTVVDLLMHNSTDWSPERFLAACGSDNGQIQISFTWVVNNIYHLSTKNTQAVTDLFAQPQMRTVFAERYLAIQQEAQPYQDYLEDTFVHTVKHALKQTAQQMAGVEAMEYISAYTQLNMDFGQLRDRFIWLYEIGMGGVGVLRSVQAELRDNPARFWRAFLTIVEECETESEDQFLLGVLALPEAQLDTLHGLIVQVHAAASATDREAALRQVRQVARQMGQTTVGRTHIRLLLKLFSDDYAGQGIGLRNWRLHRELNVGWIPDLTRRLGRLPTPVEAKGLLHYALTHRDMARREQERITYPELTRLLLLYQGEYGVNNDARRVFENGVRRRLLLNCRDVCPTCLDEGSACQIDAPGLSPLTLSRALVKEILAPVRQARTVSCQTNATINDMAEQVAALFQQDIAGPVILQTPNDSAHRLADVLSHLTDYGVADRLERRYPRVERVRTANHEMQVWLTLTAKAADER
jgi:hypothetical protein